MDKIFLLLFVPVAFSTIFTAVFFFLWKRERGKNLMLERWGISHNSGSVPTYVQEATRPVEVKIFNKVLYLGCLSFELANTWLREAGRFFTLNAAYLDGFNVESLEIEGPKKSIIVDKLSKKLYSAVLDKRFRKSYMRLMKKTVLADAVLNPNKVTVKYLSRFLNHYSMAEMLWTVYVYNHGGHVKKNYKCLLERLAAASNGISDIQSISPWSKAQTIIQSARSRLSGGHLDLGPDLSLQNKEKMKGQNQNQTGKEEKNENKQ